MNPDSEILFAESKQERSLKTMADILQAAEQLTAEANPEQFTSRSLAQKSGYALGTLVRRLGSVENVFLWAIKKGRGTLLNEFALRIAQFDPDASIHKFSEILVDDAFANIQKVNPKVMRFFENRITRREGLPADYFSYWDCFVEPYLESSRRNKTDTFRQMTKEEATLIIRNLSLFVERPFIEGNPIAGTENSHPSSVEWLLINRKSYFCFAINAF
jgi:AcrR family transcriptional regulator